MIDSALVLGVTGIVVSGIVGPAVAAEFAQRSQVGSFNRGQAAERRSGLRSVLDQAAVLLASGATNLRVLRDHDPDPDQLATAKEWMTQIFPIGQRLQLWLPHNDPVIEAYEVVRKQLVSVGESAAPIIEEQLERFERSRLSFLNLAREKLLEPISATPGSE